MQAQKFLKVGQKRESQRPRGGRARRHTERVTLLMTVEERAALDRVAAAWQRSRGDCVRLLLAEALSRLFTNGQHPGQQPDSAAEITSDAEDSHGHSH